MISIDIQGNIEGILMCPAPTLWPVDHCFHLPKKGTTPIQTPYVTSEG